ILLEKINRDASVRVLPYASITKGLKGEEQTDITSLAQFGAFAFTDDGVGVQSADMMLKAMREAASVGRSIVANCKDNWLVYSGVVIEGEESERFGLPGIPSLSESVQIARVQLLS